MIASATATQLWRGACTTTSGFSAGRPRISRSAASTSPTTSAGSHACCARGTTRRSGSCAISSSRRRSWAPPTKRSGGSPTSSCRAPTSCAGAETVASGNRWLDATWPRVRAQLPAAPARAVEIGGGSLGGFVPFLRAEGYDAVGVDPKAPDAPGYLQTEFEHAELPEDVAAVVACTSLHHVADPADVIERIGGLLAPGGTAV